MGKNTRIVNKRARFEYEVFETLEAGVVLNGQEVKSLRQGKGSIVDAFVMIRDGEAYLHNANFPGYKFADLSEYEPTRVRKLLFHKKELAVLESKVNSDKRVLVPLEVYLKGNVFKVLVAVARGKKQYQKKEALKRRDIEREVKRELKQKVR